MSILCMILVTWAVLLSSQAMAAKGPSAAEIKKHSSQTLKVGSKGTAAQCKAACDESKSCASVRYDKRTKRCELVGERSIDKKAVVPARSR